MHRFNPPPEWPEPPSDSWRPPPGWEPDPDWPDAPTDLTIVDQRGDRTARLPHASQLREPCHVRVRPWTGMSLTVF